MNFDKTKINKTKFFIIFALCIAATNEALAIQVQERSNWCWVASTQDVLAQVGINKTQTEIASRLLGAPIDQPAYAIQVAGLLNSYGMTAWEIQVPASPQQLQSTLNSGWRIIALARPTSSAVGHFIVLQAANSYGQVVISDPANGNTYVSSVSQLYSQWHWIESVVVGQPNPGRNYADYAGPSSRLDTADPDGDSDQQGPPQTTPYGYKVPDWMK